MENLDTLSNYVKIKNETSFQKNPTKITNYRCFSYSINIYTFQNEEIGYYNPLLTLEKTFDYIKTKNDFITYLKLNFSEIANEFGFIKLENLLTLLKKFFKSLKIVDEENNQKFQTEQEILLFWAYLSGLSKIFPLLLDVNVEEIFISPNTEKIVIDHYLFGRLTTSILISEREKENLLYRTAMENNIELSQLKPSIKGDLQVPGIFSLRLTGDTKPFSYDGVHINIRKLNQREFSLETLIKLNSIDPESSAFLKTIIANGINITIIGSPSSGKTTLQNALLRELPSYWRIFSFENTLETNIIKPNFFRFKIFDYLKSQNTDLLSIFSQLLHRSPDYVNLGEITTSDEAIAWNACMSAGIPIIQTIHSNSSQGLINRIKEVFNIPSGLLASSYPHIVVEVKYFWNNFRKERKIFAISEFIIDNENQLKLQTITQYDFQNKKIIWPIDPNKTNTFLWIYANKNRNISNMYHKNLLKYKGILHEV